MSYADTKMEEAAQQVETESIRARRRFHRPSHNSRGLVDEWGFQELAHHTKDRGPMLVRLAIMGSPSYWRRAITETYEDGRFKDGWFDRLEIHEVEGLQLQPRALMSLPVEKLEQATPANANPWGEGGWLTPPEPGSAPKRRKRVARK